MVAHPRAQSKTRKAVARRRHVRKRLTLTGVTVLAVAAAALWGWQWQETRAERAAVLGDVEEFDPGAVGHLGADDYESLPPRELYDHRPSTGAPHTNNVIQTGVWDRAIDERILGHNLEHGYVVAYWSPDADPVDIEALQRAAQAAIDDSAQHLIAVEHTGDEPMDDDARFAFVSWGRRVLLDAFDAEAFEAFLAEYQQASEAPEPHAGPHLGVAGGGGIDPASHDGDLLLPPLGDDSRLIREATG